MDAVTYLKEKNRMTTTCGIKCFECPLGIKNNGKDLVCEMLEMTCPEKAIEIVENWSKEHPIRTRQSAFLKIFPNVMKNKYVNEDVIDICPLAIDTEFKYCEKYANCVTCKKEYWLEDIGE